MTVTPHEFNIGDKIIITEHHSTVGIYQIHCYVKDIDGDYYVVRKRDFTSRPFRIGKYYPYMIKEN